MVGRTRSSYGNNVFINCPFDNQYRPLLRPLLFTILTLGFNPRIASLLSNSGENRIDKIVRLMRGSRWSIHDISRIKTTPNNLFSRFNLPFELGIDRGAQLFGPARLKRKRCLILETRQFDYRRALSDLSGVDIKHHRNDPQKLIRSVRDWFVETANRKRVESGTEIWYAFNEFANDFYEDRKANGFGKQDRDFMPTPEYIDAIRQWLRRR